MAIFLSNFRLLVDPIKSSFIEFCSYSMNNYSSSFSHALLETRWGLASVFPLRVPLLLIRLLLSARMLMMVVVWLKSLIHWQLKGAVEMSWTRMPKAASFWLDLVVCQLLVVLDKLDKLPEFLAKLYFICNILNRKAVSSFSECSEVHFCL